MISSNLNIGFSVVKRKIVKNSIIHIFVLLMLCIACMISFCACSNVQTKKKTIRIFADQTLKTYLPLVGDKYLVTVGKDCELQYVFDTAESLATQIQSGESCDILITSSAPAIKDLMTEGRIWKEESLPFLKSRMMMITYQENETFVSMNDLFLRTDLETDEEPEKCQRYTDLLWEIYGEEEWREEWDADYGDLWIRSDFAGIAVCTPEKDDGIIAKDILSRYGETYALLELAHLIRWYSDSSDVCSAIQDHYVTAGICCMTDLDDEQHMKVLEYYDHSDDPARIYQACRITESELTAEARQFIEFLQSETARRFFEDFGFECMR